MGVYEHPKGSKVWWVLYYANGKRRREKVGRKSDAIELYRERKSAARRGEKLPELRKKKILLREIIDDAVAYASARNRSAKDYRIKGNLLAKGLGSLALDEITPHRLEAWIEARRTSPATFNRYKAFLSLAYRLAVRNGKAEVNVARSIEHKREPSGRKRFLSREEYQAVIARLSPERAAAVTLSVFTGMRLMEQYSLAWEQVDWKRAEIRLTRTKNGDERTVPLNSVALEALESLEGREGPVFPRKFGGKKAVHPQWYKEALAAAGIRGASWHTNRHTFCSWHAMAGTPLKTIQELAGHKTISITARYSHLGPDYATRESERIVAVPKVLPIESGRKRA